MSTAIAFPVFQVPRLLKQRWVQHACFWLIYIVTTLVSDAGAWRKYPELYLEIFAATNLYMLPFTYILTLGIIPHLLYRGRWVLFVLACMALVWAACLSMYFGVQQVVGGMMKLYPELDANEMSALDFLSVNVLMLFVILGIKVARDAWVAQLARQEQERLLLTEEVSVLRAQISPHFLLNSLNTVYGLSLTEPAAVPDTVMRLSDLLRFTLYEAHTSKIAIGRELEFLRDYIALQRMRASEKLQLHVELGDVAQRPLQIAPLILLVFLENAFKYAGCNAAGERFLGIDLALSPTDVLEFKVRNSYLPDAATPSAGGMGLRNVQRRLALIYPKKHHLTLDATAGIYTAHLTIDLRP